MALFEREETDFGTDVGTRALSVIAVENHFVERVYEKLASSYDVFFGPALHPGRLVAHLGACGLGLLIPAVCVLRYLLASDILGDMPALCRQIARYAANSATDPWDLVKLLVVLYAFDIVTLRHPFDLKDRQCDRQRLMGEHRLRDFRGRAYYLTL